MAASTVRTSETQDKGEGNTSSVIFLDFVFLAFAWVVFLFIASSWPSFLRCFAHSDGYTWSKWSAAGG